MHWFVRKFNIYDDLTDELIIKLSVFLKILSSIGIQKWRFQWNNRKSWYYLPLYYKIDLEF